MILAGHGSKTLHTILPWKMAKLGYFPLDRDVPLPLALKD
jgi:hypothetical protein